MQSLTNRITLVISNNVWIAHYTGPHAQDMKTKLGTCEIRTAFTGAVKPGDIESHFRAENPQAEIYIDRWSR